MIGGGGIVAAVFLLFLIYGAAIFGIGSCVAALICFFRRGNRVALTLLCIGAVLISPALVVIHKSSEIKRTPLHVEAEIPLDMSSFELHPEVYRDDLGGFRRQMVWGEVDVDVRLSKGGVVRGSCNRISMDSSEDGKFRSLQVFYEPDMAFYRATSVEDVL